LTALSGSEVLFYPTAIDGIQERKNMVKPIWCLDECYERTCGANGVYVAAANRMV
jgi:hypothetical protein